MTNLTKNELLNLKAENLDQQGDFAKLRKFRHLYFSGAPTQAGIQELKKLGVKKVIDLKPDEENPDSHEKDHAQTNGLEYHQVPVEGCHALTLDKVRQVNQLVDHNDESSPTLIYCRSGNRASAWLAVHLYLEHNFTEDEAIAKAKETGMDKEQIEEETRKVIQALSSHK